jgi:hypothetical protein
MTGYWVTGNCRARIVLYRLQELTTVLSGYLFTGNCRARIVLYFPPLAEQKHGLAPQNTVTTPWF